MLLLLKYILHFSTRTWCWFQIFHYFCCSSVFQKFFLSSIAHLHNDNVRTPPRTLHFICYPAQNSPHFRLPNFPPHSTPHTVGWVIWTIKTCHQYDLFVWWDIKPYSTNCTPHFTCAHILHVPINRSAWISQIPADYCRSPQITADHQIAYF